MLASAATDIVPELDADTVKLLQDCNFTATMGTKLAWPEPKQYRFPLLIKQDDGWRILYHFDAISPASGMSDSDFNRYQAACRKLGEVAKRVGLRNGHAIENGQALIIPNDYVLHGREQLSSELGERLVFRSYALARGTRHSWEATMIRLDDE
jgi:hypothetical protein